MPMKSEMHGPVRGVDKLLALLARRGARAVRRTPAGGRMEIVVAPAPDSPPDDAVVVDPKVFEEALSCGLIAADEHGTHRLTVAGKAVVRRSKLTAAPSRPHAGPTADASPVATAVRRNDAESPLAWLHRRLDRDGKPLIDDAQFEAGERLRADLWLAHMTPRVTAAWTGIPQERGARGSGAGLSMADRVVAARQRVTNAFDRIGVEFAGILIDVCGHLKGLEEIERREGWPQRSAKLLLQKALTALARHYGMLPPENADAFVARRLRHWGADDYRPSAQPREGR